MNCARNNNLLPHLREDEALVVENAIRLAIDSIVNVLYGVNSARTREYQRMVADRDKEIQRLERRLGETEHELQVFRRQGCTSRQVKKEQSPVTGLQTCDDPQEGAQSGLEPSCMDTEEPAGQQECEMSFSFGLLARPLSHVSSQSHESALPSSPSRLGLDQACTSHYSESSGVSDAARNLTTSPSSSIMIKEEPCDIDDTVLIKWEMSEERIMGALENTSSLNQGKESPDGTKKLESRDRRNFPEKPHADSSGYSVTEAENLRNKKKSVPMSELPEEVQRVKRAAWRAASRRYYARKVARQQANPLRSLPLPHIPNSHYTQPISYAERRRKKLIGELPAESQTHQREAWRAASRRYYARKMSRLQPDPSQYLLQSMAPSEETLDPDRGGAHTNSEGIMCRFVSSIRDVIKAIIFRTLPNLSEDTQTQMISSLQTLGVESKEDLKFVEPEDIGDFLPATQQRKLLKEFKKEASTVTIDPQPSVAEPACVNLSSLSSPSSCFSSSSVPSFSPPSTSRVATHSAFVPNWWPERFKVPWHKFPDQLKSAVATKRRPSPEMRRIMIRVLVDEIRKYHLKPKRKECFIICRDLVRQYPSSFADVTSGGKIIGCGFTSLLSQVQRRIENINRGRSSGQNEQRVVMSDRGHKPADSYGCTHFQPGLPPGETDETVKQKRQQLQNIFEQEGVHAGEKEEVINLMKKTFCLQRNQINKTPTASFEDLRIQWPYLFTEKGIFCHFKSLTNINVLSALELAIEECGQGMEKYLRVKAKHRAQLAVSRSAELSYRIINLLLNYFDEKTEGLILSADQCSTVADVEDTLTLPISPRLILLKSRDEVRFGRWMVSIEGHVIFEGSQQSFISGLAALFATYYVFNLQYQQEAAKTLEFIQRRCIGINPEKGSKANQQRVLSRRMGKQVRKKAEIVSPPVASLIKNLMDFERGYM